MGDIGVSESETKGETNFTTSSDVARDPNFPVAIEFPTISVHYIDSYPPNVMKPFPRQLQKKEFMTEAKCQENSKQKWNEKEKKTNE